MFVKYRSCELILLGSLHAPTNSSLSNWYHYITINIRENHINKNVFYSFSKNKEEDKRRVYGKQFLCNAGFYIGLNAEEMETVLRNEGYTIQCSNRPDDRILFDCFYYSFSRNYASALLKKDGYDGLEIGK